MSASWSLEAMISFGRGAWLMVVKRAAVAGLNEPGLINERNGNAGELIERRGPGSLPRLQRAFATELHGDVVGIGQNVFAQLDLDGPQGVAHEQALGDLLRESLNEMARARQAERLH